MVDIKADMIKHFTNKDINENEYRNWVDYVVEYNHNNPKEPICYQVRWTNDTFFVSLLDLDIDTEG